MPVDDAERWRKEKLWPTYLSGGNIEFILGDLLETDSFKTPERDRLWDYVWFARQFLEQLPFWEMQPADQLLTGADTINVTQSRGKKTYPMGAQVFARHGVVYAIYLPKATECGQLDLTDAQGTLTLRWYNPRTGCFEGEATTVHGGRTRLTRLTPLGGRSRLGRAGNQPQQLVARRVCRARPAKFPFSARAAASTDTPEYYRSSLPQLLIEGFHELERFWCAVSDRDPTCLRLAHQVGEQLQSGDEFGLQFVVAGDVTPKFVELGLHFLLGSLRTIQIANGHFQSRVVRLLTGQRRLRRLRWLSSSLLTRLRTDSRCGGADALAGVWRPRVSWETASLPTALRDNGAGWSRPSRPVTVGRETIGTARIVRVTDGQDGQRLVRVVQRHELRVGLGPLRENRGAIDGRQQRHVHVVAMVESGEAVETLHVAQFLAAECFSGKYVPQLGIWAVLGLGPRPGLVEYLIHEQPFVVRTALSGLAASRARTVLANRASPLTPPP